MDQNTRQPKKDLPSPKPDPIPPYQEFLEEHGGVLSKSRFLAQLIESSLRNTPSRALLM